jgi:hypothetical protein
VLVLAVALLQLVDLCLESSHLRVAVQGLAELLLQIADLLAIRSPKLVLTRKL